MFTVSGTIGSTALHFIKVLFQTLIVKNITKAGQKNTSALEV